MIIKGTAYNAGIDYEFNCNKTSSCMWRNENELLDGGLLCRDLNFSMSIIPIVD